MTPMAGAICLIYKDQGGGTIRSFGWGYDAASRVTSQTSDISTESVSAYSYDADGQLQGANYVDSGTTDEAYTYDNNGNRETVTNAANPTGTTYDQPAADNELSTDGTYTYIYDAEGNLEYKFIGSSLTGGQPNASDSDITTYTWDNRDRMTEAAHQQVFGTVDWEADYGYDAVELSISSTYKANGVTDRVERYVWDGNNVALDFVDPDGTGSASLSLAERYLWGPAVDQLLAQENVSTGVMGDVRYAVTDNLGSVRSLVNYSAKRPTPSATTPMAT